MKTYNMLDHKSQVPVQDGNIKKSLENYFNFHFRKLKENSNEIDYTHMCKTKITVKDTSNFSSSFAFKATICDIDLNNYPNNKITQQINVIGSSQTISNNLKFYRKNIKLTTYILIEYYILDSGTELLRAPSLSYNRANEIFKTSYDKYPKISISEALKLILTKDEDKEVLSYNKDLELGLRTIMWLQLL